MSEFEAISLTELREKLTETIYSLEEVGAVLVVRYSDAAAYLVSPELFESLLDRMENLTDVQDMNALLEAYHRGENVVDAQAVFAKLGL